MTTTSPDLELGQAVTYTDPRAGELAGVVTVVDVASGSAQIMFTNGGAMSVRHGSPNVRVTAPAPPAVTACPACQRVEDTWKMLCARHPAERLHPL